MGTKRKRAGDARRRVKRSKKSVAENPFARARAAWDELVELFGGRVRAAEAAERAQRELGRDFNPADWFQRFREDHPRRDLDGASPRLAGELADTLEHAIAAHLSAQRVAAAEAAKRESETATA